MLPQQKMIERVRSLCREDERIRAAFQYGSFAHGEGDEYSDIEFVLYFRETDLETLDRKGWVEQVHSLEAFFPDEVGHFTAIFDNLVRGEFHFLPESGIETVRGWQGSAWFPRLDLALVVDRSGRLAPLLELLGGPSPDPGTSENVQALVNNFTNWVLFGINVLRRGENARALEVLSMAHRNLLKMARIHRGATRHWISPARFLEKELPADDLERFARCTSALDGVSLRRAYRETWIWGRELMVALLKARGLSKPLSLFRKVQRLIILTTPV